MSLSLCVLSPHTAKAASVVQQSIVGDPEVWEGALCTWSRLKTRLTGIKMTRKRKREEEEHTEAQGGHSLDTQSDASGLQTDSEQQKPTFRVSCRSSGALARRFSPQVCLCGSGCVIYGRGSTSHLYFLCHT